MHKMQVGTFQPLTPHAKLWLSTSVDFLAVPSKWKQSVCPVFIFFFFRTVLSVENRELLHEVFSIKKLIVF